MRNIERSWPSSALFAPASVSGEKSTRASSVACQRDAILSAGIVDLMVCACRIALCD